MDHTPSASNRERHDLTIGIRLRLEDNWLHPSSGGDDHEITSSRFTDRRDDPLIKFARLLARHAAQELFAHERPKIS
jgi:hypothetical protein